MKKFLSLVLALAMTMSLVTVSAGAKDFADADDITYVEAVEVMSEIGVVDGDTAGNFNATAGLTRGAAAKIICNLILGPTTASALVADAAPYSDVPVNSTFAGFIAFCAKENIISGYADGTFKPAAPLTGYAFMKMLLGALGYDKSVEGYEGSNWSINVAKRALNVGLDDGLTGDFNGSAYVTREQAMLYAFNALNAEMVEYDTTITIGDITIAGSKADGTDKLFREVYFSKLVPTYGDYDAFARPATTWTWKGAEVGTYTDTPDLTYTVDVKLGDIYKDLGLTEQIDAAFFRNGIAQADQPIGRGVTTKLGVGNGTLTEVYYDSDAKVIEIVSIDTYVGDVTATKAATASKDAYIVLGESRYNSPMTSQYNKFETDEAFEVDDVVLYTYSELKDEIVSVEKITPFEGVLNTIYKNNKLNIDGTTYELSCKVGTGCDNTDTDLNVKSTYDVYLDAYGYVIDMSETKYVSQDYAFVTDVKAGDSWNDSMARLVYLDGTAAKVVTDKSYTSEYASSYYLATHKLDDGETVLKKVATGNTVYDKAVSTLSMTNGVSKIVIGSNTVYTNSKTIVVVECVDTDKITTYTGTNNIPTVTITDAGDTAINAWCKDGNIVTYMYVRTVSNNVTNGKDDVTFLSGVSLSKRVTDTDTTDYYVYNAVVDGNITTVKVEANKVVNTNNVVFNNSTINKDNIVTALSWTGTSSVISGTGVKKLTGEYTLGFYDGSAYQYYTIDDDCLVYEIDKDGVITKASVSAVVTDAAQNYTAVINDKNHVTYVFLDEVAEVVTGAVATPDVYLTVTGVRDTVDLSAKTASNIQNAIKALPVGAYMFSVAQLPDGAEDYLGTAVTETQIPAMIFFNVQAKNDNQNYYLFIYDANGMEKFVSLECVLGDDTDMHTFWYSTQPYSIGGEGSNNAIGEYATQDWASGVHTWKVMTADGSSVLASGSFTIA